MRQYHELLQHILDHGADKGDRTGTGTRSVFGWQMRFDLGAGFPLITTKKLHVKSILRKLGMHSRVEAAVAAAEHGLGKRRRGPGSSRET